MSRISIPKPLIRGRGRQDDDSLRKEGPVARVPRWRVTGAALYTSKGKGVVIRLSAAVAGGLYPVNVTWILRSMTRES